MSNHRKHFIGRAETGITIVLFAMLITTLLALAGFVIEIVTAENTKQECMVIAEQIATASLRKLNEVRGDNSNPENILNQTLLDARNIAANSRILARLQNGATLEQIELSTTIHQGSTPPAGILTPGTWYDDNHSCGENVAPCFEEYNSSRSFSDVNAFKVKIQSPTYLQQVFSKIFGGAPISVSAETIGVVMPRRFVILLDLSGSITEANYLHMNPTDDTIAGIPELASYRYDQETPAPPSSRVRSISARFAYQDVYLNGNGEPRLLEECTAADGSTPTAPDFFDDYSYLSDRFSYCAMEDALPEAFSGADPWESTTLRFKKHYRSDYYQHGIINFNAEDLPAGAFTQFRYDYHSAVERRDVEPLFSILRAIHDSVTTMSQTMLPSDRIGLIGFDHQVFDDSSAVRMFPLSNDVAALLSATTPEICDPAVETNPEHCVALEDSSNWINKFLWPRPSYTDAFPALTRAAEWILAADADTPGPKKNTVLLFTDGMFNCQDVGGVRKCDELTSSYNSNAYENLHLHVMPNYRARKIELHTLLLSDRSRPNYVRWQDPENPGHCVDPIRGRKLGYVMTRGRSEYGGGLDQIVWGNASWARPNQQLWDLAAATGGMFFPIMPPGDPDIPMAGSCTHNYIARHPVDEWGPILSNPIPQRYFVDPGFRTKEQQMRDYMNTIMGEIPIRLVVEYPHPPTTPLTP